MGFVEFKCSRWAASRLGAVQCECVCPTAVHCIAVHLLYCEALFVCVQTCRQERKERVVIVCHDKANQSNL